MAGTGFGAGAPGLDAGLGSGASFSDFGPDTGGVADLDVGLVSAGAALDAGGVSNFGVEGATGLGADLVSGAGFSVLGFDTGGVADLGVGLVSAGVGLDAGVSDSGAMGAAGFSEGSIFVESGLVAGAFGLDTGDAAGFVSSFGRTDSEAGVTTPFGLMDSAGLGASFSEGFESSGALGCLGATTLGFSPG